MPATPPRGWGLPGPAPRQAGPGQAGPGQAGPGQAGPGQAATLPAFDAIVLAGGRAERLGGVDKPGLVVGTATMAATVTRAAVAAGARRVVLVGPPRAELAGDLAGDGGELAVVREDPPGGGPVAALRAGLADSGLAEAGAPWVVLLAADLPFLRAEHIRELMAAAVRQRDDAGDDARRDADARSAGRCDMEPDDLSGDRSGAPVQRVGGSFAGGSSGSRGAGAILTDERGAPQWLAGCWPAARLRSALAGYPGSSLRGLLGPLRPARISLAGPAGTPPPWLDCDTPAELAAARGWYDRAAPQPVLQPAQPAPQPRPAAPPSSHSPHRPEGRIVTTLDRWTEAACAELGLRPDDVATRTILDLARDVAHQVERPAAPLTAFLLGLAAGRGTPVDDAARRLRELAAQWPPAG